MPASAARGFHDEAMSRGYPKAYRTTVAQQIFEAAMKLEGLDEETRQAIADLNQAYMADLDNFRQQVVDMIRDFEPKRERNRVETYTARMAGQQVARLVDPTLEKVRQGDEMGEQYIRLLQALLTDEQFHSLPGAERWLRQKEQKEPIKRGTGRNKLSPGPDTGEDGHSPTRPRPGAEGRKGSPAAGGSKQDR